MIIVKIIPLPTLAATEDLARRLAVQIQAGDVVAFTGDLGAGKTTLARAMIHALGVTGDVPSPTFTLVQTYDTPHFALYHFDLYRITHEAELDEIGWDDALGDGVVMVEWPERSGRRMPRDYLALHMAHDGAGRSCTITPHGAMTQREFVV